MTSDEPDRIQKTCVPATVPNFPCDLEQVVERSQDLCFFICEMGTISLPNSALPGREEKEVFPTPTPPNPGHRSVSGESRGCSFVGAAQSSDLTPPLSPRQVNVMLVLATVLTFVHPFMVYWECRRERKSPATA